MFFEIFPKTKGPKKTRPYGRYLHDDITFPYPPHVIFCHLWETPLSPPNMTSSFLDSPLVGSKSLNPSNIVDITICKYHKLDSFYGRSAVAL